MWLFGSIWTPNTPRMPRTRKRTAATTGAKIVTISEIGRDTKAAAVSAFVIA